MAAWWGERPLSQLAVLLGVFALFSVLGANTVDNLGRLGITVGFGYLDHPANFEIGESLVAYTSGDSYARALGVGILNTALVSIIGCLLATLLGVALGIGRLSANLLISRAVQLYVEVIRNTPLLLQLFFWSATIHALPGPRQAFEPLTGVFLTNRGLYMPALAMDGAAVFSLLLLGGGALAGVVRILVHERRHGPMERAAKTALLGAVAVLLLGVLALCLGGAVSVEPPRLGGFNITGGWVLSPEFLALLVGLVINASAVICEIVRSGIEAVPEGQWEAARSLGLTRGRTLRLVVLPQALRVVIPLMTSSYLSLTKNSSLAVAIGFPDLVSVVNTSANQTGHVFEAIALMMAVYLTISLTVSAALNFYNHRLSLGR
ncbi:binding-protein dependent transport system inner membrane protein [Rhodospirillum rubrum F11]|nr:binding-protein dependent transport system inner membrane protein [Rhodospirillum rubrum F11]